MRFLKALVLVSVLALLAAGLTIGQTALVRAQTGAATAGCGSPAVDREIAAGIIRITGCVPVSGGAILFSHRSGSIETYYLVNNQFIQLAWFGPSEVQTSGSSAVSLTSPISGYRTVFSPSSQGSNYRSVEIFNASGASVSKFEFKLP